jgi:predicted HTH domain antitoxin
MKNEILNLEFSPDVLAALKIGIDELGQEIKLLAAIYYFQEKRLSLGKTAELARINRLEFMDILSKKGIVLFDYDESALAVELKGIEKLEPDDCK